MLRVKALRTGTVAWLFLVPALALTMVFMIYPLIDSFRLSFYEWDLLSTPKFVGLANFKALLIDSEEFYTSLSNNIYFSVFTTLGTVVIGYALAIALDRKVRGWRQFRVIFYIPVTVSSVVTGMLWLRILEPNAGILNTALRWLKLDFLALPWMSDSNLVVWVIIAVTVWQYSGFTMVFFLAAMQNIPTTLYEAAQMDGIRWYQEIRYLTLPLTKPVLIIVTMIQLIYSFKVFDMVWVMSKGGPGYSSSVLGTYLYLSAFKKFQVGFAEAIAVVMFLIIFSLSLAYLRLARFEESAYEH